jgi:DNA polymerase-1
MRREAKATNFGIIYGQGAHGLSQAAGISYAKARDFIAAYFKTYPAIKKMRDQSIADATEKGYAETIFGRKRFLPELSSPSAMVRRMGERMAINTPIQGSAADLIKKAMVEINRQILEKDDSIKLLLQIHDELVFEADPKTLDKYMKMIEDIMENTIKLKVPIIAQQSRGRNWGELK